MNLLKKPWFARGALLIVLIALYAAVTLLSLPRVIKDKESNLDNFSAQKPFWKNNQKRLFKIFFDLELFL